MSGLPEWIAGYAGLTDDALAALANKGLVRRAEREAGKLTQVAASADEVSLSHPGPPPVMVRLLPGGPTAARCPCPAAGVCVHVVAACRWARDAGSWSADEPAAEVDVAAELLTWDPAATNRAAGVAAVRRVHGMTLGADTQLTATGNQLSITWPEGPTVIVLPGADLAGLIVSGSHSEVALRAARLEAVIRVWVRHGRAWVWPDGIAEPGAVQPGQREAMSAVLALAEGLVSGGLSQVRLDAVQRLEQAGRRARLEELHLLSALVGTAAGRVGALARRDDEVGEAQALAALAQCWALAYALREGDAPLPGELLGGPTRKGESAQTGVLVPLSARWWTAGSGARGITMHLWDSDAGRLEVVTTGRAAGADPTFRGEWDLPLIWGASPARLCAGPFRLRGAERRDDGTLSVTVRTSVEPVGALGDVVVAEVAAGVNHTQHGSGSLRFGTPADPVRVILPRLLGALGNPEVDEIHQEVIWRVSDVAGVDHRLRLDDGRPLDTLTSVLAHRYQVLAVIATGDRPDALWVVRDGARQLISLTLTPVPVHRHKASYLMRLRLKRLAEQKAAEPALDSGPLEQLCRTVADVLETLAATGRTALSPRQVDAVGRCAHRASQLGLRTLAAALAALQDPVEPAAVLRASFLLGRLEHRVAGH